MRVLSRVIWSLPSEIWSPSNTITTPEPLRFAPRQCPPNIDGRCGSPSETQRPTSDIDSGKVRANRPSPKMARALAFTGAALVENAEYRKG